MTAVPPPRPFADLALGDPHYGPPPEARVAAIQAILGGSQGYLPEAGLPALRAALAERLRDRNGIDASPDEVAVTTGASLGILAAAGAVTRPGDRVLVPEPGFPLYRLMARTIGVEVAGYPLLADRAYEPDWAVLGERAGGAALLLWNFPSNPTGAVAPRAWSGAFRDLLARNPHLVVLADEVYEDVVLDGEHVGAAALAGDARDRCLSVFSFSKGLGMTGMRVGYVHAPTAALAAAIAQRQWSAAMSAPAAGQWAALAALHAGSGYRADVLASLRANRDAAHAALGALGLHCDRPPAGFFLWADTSSLGLTGAELATECEQHCGVRVAPGTLFGPDDEYRVRVSYAVPSDDLAAALDRIGAFVGSRYAAARRPGSVAGA